MKKAVLLVLAAIMALSATGLAESKSGGLSFATIAPYKGKKIENAGVAQPKIDMATLAPYEGKEIENTEVAQVEMDIATLAPYEGKEIENTGVSQVEMDIATLAPYEGREISAKQVEISSEIYAALQRRGLDVDFDAVTGQVRIDAALLYAVDAYKVTDAGKDVLRDVFKAYCEVLSQEQYRDLVTRVVITGHTDSTGSYAYNLELSRKRAEAVMAYCLSDECGIEDVEWLASVLTAEGHSYDELIYNADGSVNMAASRRVEIGFEIEG